MTPFEKYWALESEVFRNAHQHHIHLFEAFFNGGVDSMRSSVICKGDTCEYDQYDETCDNPASSLVDQDGTIKRFCDYHEENNERSLQCQYTEWCQNCGCKLHIN